MVAEELHVIGEEWMMKTSFRQDQITRNTTIEVLLYDDSTDTLTETDDLSAITTEPSDGNYTRQTATLDSSDVTLSKNANGNWEVDIADQVFDLTNTTGTADAYAITVEFTSDEAGDASATRHILWSDSLDATYDLSQIDEGTFTDGRLDLD